MKPGSITKSKVVHHLLLVDENQYGLAARKWFLQEQGYAITTATNGEEALEAVSKGTFDLIVTDFRMSKMNGIELIGRVRAQQPQVSIILLSGLANSLGLDEASTGADAVISKGANEIAYLQRAVTRLLARRPMGSQGRSMGSQEISVPKAKTKATSV
jgi:CheY-like chemotaxis protein